METNKYDLIIIGGGAAGFAAISKANELNAKTAIINNDAVGLGGTCVNVGCLPTKHLLHVADQLHQSNNPGFNSLKGSAELDFSDLINSKNDLIASLRHSKYEDVLEGLPNVTLIKGDAKFAGKNIVEVAGKQYEAGKFIIATGSSTIIPPIDGIEEVDYVTNIEALDLKSKPKSMVILGGGALGVEFAQLYSRFGTKVCLVQKHERLVPREEPELSELLKKYLVEEGIVVCTGAEVKSVKQEGNVKVIRAEISGSSVEYRGDILLIAVGRRPNSKGFNLESTGVKLGGRGEIVVNEEMQTSVPNIWAAGDVTGEPMLETVAAKEGSIAASNSLSNTKKRIGFSVVPHAIFTSPSLASVGLTGSQAQEKGIGCKCKTITMDLVPKAIAVNESLGAIKIVVDSKSNQVAGIHILSYMAHELIGEAAMIIKNKMTVDEVVDTLHVFPTMSEAIKIGAQSFSKDVSKMSCCVE